jgi:DNA-binding transcriptional regulator YiaG
VIRQLNVLSYTDNCQPGIRQIQAVSIMTPSALTNARQRLALSQAALARLLGVHPQTISLWERGTHEVPGPVALALKAIERSQHKGE